MRIAYRELGEGTETVVLVHGIGVTGAYMMRLGRLLARHRRVLVPDLPGWGRSDRPAQPLDVRGAADALGAFVDHVAPRSTPAIVGNSLGCQFALDLAARGPGDVGPLVLIGPTVDPAYRSFACHAVRLFVDAAREPPSLLRLIARDYLWMGPVRVVATARYALRDRPEEKLPEVAVPTLVVRGERDGITTRAWAERCAALAPRGTFVEVAGAAHAPHWSHARVVADLVEWFLEEARHGGDEVARRLDHRHVPGAG